MYFYIFLNISIFPSYLHKIDNERLYFSTVLADRAFRDEFVLSKVCVENNTGHEI